MIMICHPINLNLGAGVQESDERDRSLRQGHFQGNCGEAHKEGRRLGAWDDAGAQVGVVAASRVYYAWC